MSINSQSSPGRLISKQVTIASSGTKTAAIDLAGMTLVGLLFGTLTSTAMSFETSDAIAGTFVPVKSTTSGTALSYTVAQNTYAAIDPKDVQGLNFIKLVAGSSEGGLRTITLLLKGF